MKVALVGAFPPQQKGEASYLGEYAVALRRELGSDAISVISQYADTPGTDEWRGFTVDRAIRDRSRGTVSFSSQRELVDAVLRHAPDIVHLHYGPNPDYGGRLGEPLVGALRRLRAAGIPTVITLHSLWLPENVIAAPAAARLPGFLRPLVVSYFAGFTRGLVGASARVLCLVSNERSPMTERFSSAYRLSGLGEEVHACDPHPTPLPAGDPMLLAFGFIRPDKGFDVLVRAFDSYVREGGRGRLLIAGRAQSPSDESYADAVATLAASVPDGRCTFDRRFISDDELAHALEAATVVVLPYLQNVGSSGPLHQALSAGRPVIATDVGHNSALRGVIDLVRPADEADLLLAIRDVLSTDDSIRSRAETVAAFATERSWPMLARKNAAIYDDLLRQN
jgi:glycosyltransferase involved in cell wall biosynthesis